MTYQAVIHGGPAAPRLKEIIDALTINGVNCNHIFIDIFDCLKHKHDFVINTLCLKTEIEYGDYYRHKLQEEPLPVMTGILSEMALLSERIAYQLYRDMVERGIYDNDGLLPFEFKSFDGKLIHLQGRPIP